jgi:hypothetical protein
MKATATVNKSTVTLVECIVNPDVTEAWCTAPPQIKTKGESLTSEIFPEGANVAQGDWCADTLQQVNGGMLDGIGEACLQVFP